MRCPECNEEMQIFGEPQIMPQPIMAEGQEYPTEVKIFRVVVYSCNKCNVKASKAESKSYTICTCTDHCKGE